VESLTITGPVQRRDASRNATDRSVNYSFRGLARNSTANGPNFYMADILVLISFITDADKVKCSPLEIAVYNTGYRADPSGCESKASICGRSLARISGSNRVEGMNVFSCECYLLSGMG